MTKGADIAFFARIARKAKETSRPALSTASVCRAASLELHENMEFKATGFSRKLQNSELRSSDLRFVFGASMSTFQVDVKT